MRAGTLFFPATALAHSLQPIAYGSLKGSDISRDLRIRHRTVPQTQPYAVRWRGTVLNLVGALVLSLICLGGIDTLTHQVSLMAPPSWSAAEQQAIEDARRTWRADRQVNNTIHAFLRLHQGNPSAQELSTWVAGEADNGLPLLAEVLVRLRAADIGSSTQPAAASQPTSRGSTAPTATTRAFDEQIPVLLKRLETAPPLRLQATRLREILVDAMTRRGIEPRRAEHLIASVRAFTPLADYRPVIRELVNRLLAMGQRCRDDHRPADAELAFAAVVRLLTDMISDSPLPDVALLAAERLPEAVRDLHAARPTGTDPELAAQAVEDFRRRWLAVSDHEISLMPTMSVPALSVALQRRALGTFTASVCLLACGWLLALIALMLIVVVLWTRRFGPVPLTWRWKGWGAVIAPVVVVMPALATILLLSCERVPFLWLFSMRSLGSVVLLPVGLIVLWALATLSCVQPVLAPRQGGLPWPALAGGIGFVLVVVVLTAIFVPLHVESWRPPAGVQLFRRLVSAGGLACLPVLVTWLVMVVRARRRAGLPPGTWARAGLCVASSAMFIMLLAAVVGLALNARQDARHAAAFARAAGDPIADRLGPQWFEACFAPARSTIR